MFIANGANTFEWKPGWHVEISGDYFIMALPGDEQRIVDVPVGVLSSAQVRRCS